MTGCRGDGRQSQLVDSGESLSSVLLGPPDYSDVCSLDGHHPGIVGKTCRPSLGMVFDIGWGGDPSERFPELPPGCQNNNADEYNRLIGSGKAIEFRIDDRAPLLAMAGPTGQFRTAYVATALNLGSPCTVYLGTTLQQKRLKLKPGQKIFAFTRSDARNPETDVNTTHVFRDENGKLLAAQADSARKEVWHADLIPEFSVEAGERICPQQGADPTSSDFYLIRFSVVSAGGKCAIDGKAARCCDIDGEIFEVFSENSLFEVLDQPFPAMDITAIRKDLLEYVPVSEWTEPTY